MLSNSRCCCIKWHRLQLKGGSIAFCIILIYIYIYIYIYHQKYQLPNKLHIAPKKSIVSYVDIIWYGPNIFQSILSHYSMYCINKQIYYISFRIQNPLCETVRSKIDCYQQREVWLKLLSQSVRRKLVQCHVHGKWQRGWCFRARRPQWLAILIKCYVISYAFNGFSLNLMKWN